MHAATCAVADVEKNTSEQELYKKQKTGKHTRAHIMTQVHTDIDPPTHTHT